VARKSLSPATWTVVAAVEALPPGPWVVACSGGADSLALAWAAGFVGRRRGTGMRALVVDHGLQAGSDAVASSVAAQLAQLPVPDAEPLVVTASVVRVVVPRGAGPEASAREARYAALEAGVRPGERVLLGHTLDDQAETVLLGLARGSGARSLAGMSAERGVFVRPLLGLGREVTAAACAELGLTPWHDPHNAEARFARVRVRETVLPMLERELGPGVREALARTASQLRRDADALDAAARGALESAPILDLDARVALDARTGTALGPPGPRTDAGSPGSASGEPPETLHCGWLAGLDPAIRDRVLRDWLLARGASDLTASHLAAVAALVTDWRGQRGVDVPGARVRRADGRLLAD
jgi:tRNA(Ile)-lysidine synthase